MHNMDWYLDTAGGPTKSKGDTCGNCHEMGHFARNCPAKGIGWKVSNANNGDSLGGSKGNRDCPLCLDSHMYQLMDGTKQPSTSFSQFYMFLYLSST